MWPCQSSHARPATGQVFSPEAVTVVDHVTNDSWQGILSRQLESRNVHHARGDSLSRDVVCIRFVGLSAGGFLKIMFCRFRPSVIKDPTWPVRT